MAVVAMTIFDLEKGYVVALTGASFDESEQTWSARGATVTYLASNGLNGRIEGSDDPRNVGSHRGNNGATMMVRFDEVQAGRVNHVLKVASGPDASTRSVFPMVGSDGDSADPYAPPHLSSAQFGTPRGPGAENRQVEPVGEVDIRGTA